MHDKRTRGHCINKHADSTHSYLCIVQEVQYYQKMGIENFRNDPILADACRADVDKYCSKTQPGAQQTAWHTLAPCRQTVAILMSFPVDTNQLSSWYARSSVIAARMLCRVPDECVSCVCRPRPHQQVFTRAHPGAHAGVQSGAAAPHTVRLMFATASRAVQRSWNARPALLPALQQCRALVRRVVSAMVFLI